MCSTARRSEALIASPANMRSRAASTPAVLARASAASRPSIGPGLFGEVQVQAARIQDRPLHPVGLGLEQAGESHAARGGGGGQEAVPGGLDHGGGSGRSYGHRQRLVYQRYGDMAERTARDWGQECRVSSPSPHPSRSQILTPCRASAPAEVAPLASEPLYAGDRRPGADAEGRGAGAAKALPGLKASPGVIAVQRIRALAPKDRDARQARHEGSLRPGGPPLDGDLKCILKGVSEDLPRKLAERRGGHDGRPGIRRPRRAGLSARRQRRRDHRPAEAAGVFILATNSFAPALASGRSSAGGWVHH